jgi:hypothetical protein
VTQHKNILVVACARSGTLFVSRCFKAAGLDVLHENVGDAGSVSCFLPADTLPPRPKHFEKGKHRDGTTYDMFKWDHTFHQVRNPLKVVCSAEVIVPKEDWIWMSTFLPIDSSWSRLRRSIHYVYLWNRLCEARNPELRYKVEDIAKIWPEMLERSGFPRVPYPTHVPTTTHRSSGIRKAKDRTWDELSACDHEATERLKDMAREYGYAVP